ncbi:MAG: vanadium-dependent haloperoxidase [Flavobacteriales bacterium]|nr:vanadium-dependent haloperoxidase [Flavobacteriales bacterium]
MAPLLLWTACQGPTTPAGPAFGAEDLRTANRKLLEVAMVDGFSPPVAARVYVYPHLAHYGTLRLFRPNELEPVLPLIHDAPDLSTINTDGADAELTALLAFCRIGRTVVFSEFELDGLADVFLAKAKAHGIPEIGIQASVRTAEAVADAFAPWMKSDGYVTTRTLDRFTSSKEPGHWVETSPDYTTALEPHWQKIRPMMIPNAAFDTVPPMPPYSTDPGSAFHAMVKEVYDGAMNLTDSTRMIALYWDDNPNISSHRGHMVTQEHRISPPGHWLNIVSTHSRAQQSDLHTTTKAYTWCALAMYDGVIACWNEKFRTDLVRPITYVQELIDPDWNTVIQTPPFPEYPSGHSVTSAAAASVLTAIYGDDQPFTDSTEVLFGMGPRHFLSFHDAGWEVSMSRFYGGIHYMKSIEEGNRQGRRIGDLVVATINQE